MQTAAKRIKWERLWSNWCVGAGESGAEAADRRADSKEAEPEGNLLNGDRGW